MALADGAMQNFNKELTGSIEGLRARREELHRSISKDEEEKAKVQQQLQLLTERSRHLGESLQKKTKARAEYDKTIQDTESAFMKIIESSQTLLRVLAREAANLDTKNLPGASAPGPVAQVA